MTLISKKQDLHLFFSIKYKTCIEGAAEVGAMINSPLIHVAHLHAHGRLGMSGYALQVHKYGVEMGRL